MYVKRNFLKILMYKCKIVNRNECKYKFPYLCFKLKLILPIIILSYVDFTFVGKDVNAIILYCQKLAFNVHIFLTLRPYLHEYVWIKKSYFLFCNSFFIYINGILYKCISKNTPITLCSIFSSGLSFFLLEQTRILFSEICTIDTVIPLSQNFFFPSA